MKTISRLASVAVLALAVAGGAAMAEAQTKPTGSPATSEWHHGMGGAYSVQNCAESDAHLAGMFAYAEARLKLTDAQKPAFKTLTDTIKAAHEPVSKLCTDLAAQPEPTTLPARLDRMQKAMDARSEAMHKALPAVSQFYATLTPDQQKVADEMMSHRHGHGMSQGMGQGMGMGMHQ
jgi:hypothetical protein